LSAWWICNHDLNVGHCKTLVFLHASNIKKLMELNLFTWSFSPNKATGLFPNTSYCVLASNSSNWQKSPICKLQS
jgi:hypothetical protein